MNLLEEIVDNKRGEVITRQAQRPLNDLKAAARDVALRPKFSEALRSAPIGLIAEVKRRSPSAGAIRDPFDPCAIGKAYQAGGAQAISCLMDNKYFGGGEDDFRAVRSAIDLPMLYKEFVVDPWQVWHAREVGASAVLLIAAALAEADLAGLKEEVCAAGLEVLFEVHDEEEMALATRLECEMVGINNRNLKTFETTLETTLRLRDQAPEHAVVISESGIRNAEDVSLLKSEGIDGILVGEHLLRREDLKTAVHDLMGNFKP